MRKMQSLATVLALGALFTSARADTESLLAGVAKQYTAALAAVRCTIEDEAGARTVIGPAVCIDPAGILMTLALDARINPETLKQCEIILPGVDGAALPAKLLGIDPLSGLAFVQATRSHTWAAVKFVPADDLPLGKQVASIGLMVGQAGHVPYVGSAYVSASLRTPARLMHVTGGSLTGPCSPVFTSDGKAIGVVGNQAFVKYQMRTARGVVDVDMRDSYETSFFLPTEEFAHALANVPASGAARRLPWMGVNKFEAVSAEQAKELKLESPGVMIDELIPGQPADKAGLKVRDVIVAVDGVAVQKLPSALLTTQNFLRDIMRLPADKKITLTVFRQGKTQDVPLALAPMPTLPNEAQRYFHGRLGLLLRDKVMLDRFLDKRPAGESPGMVVVGVVKDSPAAAAGLQPGDLVTQVNGLPVGAGEQLQKSLAAVLVKDLPAKVALTVRRGDEDETVTLAVPAAPAPATQPRK